MTKGAEQNARAAPLLDRRDERVKYAEGIGGSVRALPSSVWKAASS